jgi:hypothetical protein
MATMELKTAGTVLRIKSSPTTTYTATIIIVIEAGTELTFSQTPKMQR